MISEKKMNLFDNIGTYYLAHCISADFGMSGGIVLEFNKRFDMKNKLIKTFPNYLNEWVKSDCILYGNVLNLVTKERVYHKPTYESLKCSLVQMKEICEMYNIMKIAMPRIGCGIDGLDWDIVKEILIEVFENSDIDILICTL